MIDTLSFCWIAFFWKSQTLCLKEKDYNFSLRSISPENGLMEHLLLGCGVFFFFQELDFFHK